MSVLSYWGEPSVAIPPHDESPGDSWHAEIARDISGCPRWTSSFARTAKDHRYYDILRNTVAGFDYLHLTLRDGYDTVRAVQPAFVVEQDLTIGVTGLLRSLIDRARTLVPSLLRQRILMIGSSAGQGALDISPDAPGSLIATSLAHSLNGIARQLGAGLIVFKDFAKADRDMLAPLEDHGFTRIPSMPMTEIDLDFVSFEDYLRRHLSRSARKDIRRKFRAASLAVPLKLEVLRDVSPIVDEIYPLYLQVYERSDLHFEKLTKDYLIQVGTRMPDRARFFVWRQNGKIVAFNLCLVHGDAIYDEYVGFDYAVALDIHLYHQTYRDVIEWALVRGYKRFISNPLNYDPKRHLRQRLRPLDLYVRHTNGLINRFLHLLLPLIEPTRYDHDLKKFPDYAELR